MTSALLYLSSPGPGLLTALPYPIWSQGLAHKTCQGTTEALGTHLSGQLTTDAVWGDASTLCGLGTGQLLAQGSPDVKRPEGQRPPKSESVWFFLLPVQQ